MCSFVQQFPTSIFCFFTVVERTKCRGTSSSLYAHTYLVLSSHIMSYSKRMDQPGKVANPARGQLNRENQYFRLHSRLRIWSRETGSAVPSRVSLLISILMLNVVLTYGIPPKFRGASIIYSKPPYAVGSVSSLSGQAIAYRWRSLLRVRRHRASKPQGSSKRVLPCQVNMDQLICASLFHTHYWYEVVIAC